MTNDLINEELRKALAEYDWWVEYQKNQDMQLKELLGDLLPQFEKALASGNEIEKDRLADLINAQLNKT